jgi:hypothetical protein
MSTTSVSMSELLDMAVDKLPPLRRTVAKFRLASRRYRSNLLNELCLHCCDNPDCSPLLGSAWSGLMAGTISPTDKFGIDPDKLERLLQIIIEYLPKLLEIILPLFMQTILFVLAVCILGSSANAQCAVDPITGQMRCQPIKKAVAAVGKTVSAVGAAITPDSVPLPVQYGQTYTILEFAPSAPVESSPVCSGYSTSGSFSTTSYSAGWSKSWHKVLGQPLRNVGRRLLGR